MPLTLPKIRRPILSRTGRRRRLRRIRRPALRTHNPARAVDPQIHAHNDINDKHRADVPSFGGPAFVSAENQMRLGRVAVPLACKLYYKIVRCHGIA